MIAPGTNLLVAEINSQRRAAALNILNFVWALGAVAGPALIALFARDGQLIRLFIGLAVLLSVIALLIARRSFADSSSGPIQPKPNRKGRARFERSAFRAWASPYALLTAALIFIYVGTETAAAGWIASYAQRIVDPRRSLPLPFPCEILFQKGQEMGWFEHGSTIIVLAPKGIVLSDTVQTGATIRMGEELMRFAISVPTKVSERSVPPLASE